MVKSSIERINLSLTKDEINIKNRKMAADVNIILKSVETKCFILIGQRNIQSTKVNVENKNLWIVLTFINLLSKKRGITKTKSRINNGIIFLFAFSIYFIQINIIKSTIQYKFIFIRPK